MMHSIRCTTAYNILHHGTACFKTSGSAKMVDPKRIVSYEDMQKVTKTQDKVIIDVRNPDEVSQTGKIPTSINIPLASVSEILSPTVSDKEFQDKFRRAKPSQSDELVFYCHSGRRASQALDQALKMGYINSKTYMGSWEEWSRKRK